MTRYPSVSRSLSMGWKKRNFLKLFTASKADHPPLISPGRESPQQALSLHTRHRSSTPNEAFITAQSSRFSQNSQPLFAQYTSMHTPKFEPVGSTSRRANLEGCTPDCVVCIGEHYSVTFSQQAPHNIFRLIIPYRCYMKVTNSWHEQM